MLINSSGHYSLKVNSAQMNYHLVANVRSSSHETVFHSKYVWVSYKKQLNFYVTKLVVYAVSFKSRSYRVNKHPLIIVLPLVMFHECFSNKSFSSRSNLKSNLIHNYPYAFTIMHNTLFPILYYLFYYIIFSFVDPHHSR